MRDERGPSADLESAEKEAVALRHVTDALAEDVKDDHDKQEVIEAVGEATHHYDDATVREFVPILVEREARQALRHRS